MELQFITHTTERYDHYQGAQLALEGGCRWIQLRMKDASLSEIKKEALRILPICRSYGATFLLDDHLLLAKEVGADGVHLGKQDMPIAEARKLVSDEFIIGGTANSFEDVLMHYQAGANYIGCGPFRFTTTKKNLSPILGLEGYQSIVKQMQEKGIKLPVVAIGGITYEDIPSILKVGIEGIALSGTILQAENPKEETARIMELFKKIKKEEHP
ncbi:MAG: thiamine phosphate synthase [Phocaeicola sp.]